MSNSSPTSQNLINENPLLFAVFNFNPDPMAISDVVTGRIIFVNGAFSLMSGYPENECLGVSSADLQLWVNPEDRERMIKILEKHKEVSGMEVSMRKKDGEIRQVLFFARFIDIAEERYLLTLARDITESKRAHETLRESEALHNTILSNVGAFIYIKDSHYRYTYVNSSVCKLFGRQQREIIGKDDAEFFSPASVSEIMKSDRLVIEKGDTIRREEKNLVSTDSIPRTYWVVKLPLHDKSGNIVGLCGISTDITDLQRTEQELKEVHQRMDQIIDYLPDATLVIDNQGKVIAWNKAIEQMTGIPAAEMLGKDDYEYALPFYGERRPILIDLVLKPQKEFEARYVSTSPGDSILEGEAYMPALRGGEVYLSGKAGVLADSKGNTVGAIESIRDITDRRKAEEKYLAIFDNAVEGIFQTTPEGRILTANPAMVKLAGYDSVEDLLSNITNIIQIYADPADRQSFRRAIEDNGFVSNYEVLCVRKNGQKIWISVNAQVIRNKEGKIDHYDGFFKDITERKKMEDDLRQSEERLRGIVETSNAGIILMTVEGKILFANRQIARMLGCTVEELTGTNYHDYVYPEERNDISRNISQLESINSNQLHAQRRYRCLDGQERWGYISGGRINVSPDQYHVVLVISDITEVRKIEMEKKLLKDHLRQAQKMEAIGTLAGGIAHDFNNILASMMGFTEMAARETRADVQKTYHDRVLQACERAKKLVHQILSFSRQQEQERQPVDIRLIIKEALTMLRATLPATIEIHQSITSEPTIVMADPTQIHQILMNLCTNAAHAMRDKGGVLDIGLANIELVPSEPLPHPDLQTGPYVRLSVRDTGHGIASEIKDKIYDPFFTTKNAKEGTGLGLSVVYGIVKSCGGTIDLQSSPGRGATFTIYLPRVHDSAIIRNNESKEVVFQGREHILFIDDEEPLVVMFRSFFQSLGYQVTATVSSTEALRLFQEKPQQFDLVITDMTMPELTGEDQALELLKIRPGLPIILCTGYSESMNREKARKLNIREFVFKPVSLQDLRAAVRRVLNR